MGTACVVGFLCCVSVSANATGISLGGTRLIFNGGKDTASMSVTNSSDQDVWLMRFWVSPYDVNEVRESGEAKTPFIVTPPLYRLDPQSALQLRVNRVGDGLPEDRESVFYLNSLAIPPKKGEKGYEKAVQSGVQFAVNTRIKLFYRPAALNDKAVINTLPSKLMINANEGGVMVKNPTPYYITLVQLLNNGKVLKTDKDTMIAPYGTLSLPTGQAHGRLSYQTVDDNGARTPIIEKTY